MVYGYARCSTNEEKQDINRQKRELYQLGVSEDKYIYWEYGSGIKEDRVELQKLLDIVMPGDVIVTTEVSRLTRSTKQLCEILKIVQEKNLVLNIGGSFKLDCSSGTIDPMTEGMVKMWGVFAEMERNIISTRVKSGMANAIAKGKRVGRPERKLEDLPPKFIKNYPLYVAKKINKSDLAKICGCSRGTIYNYLELITNQEKSNEESKV